MLTLKLADVRSELKAKVESPLPYSWPPGGGLGIYTGRDQQSIFRVLNFENLYFLGTGQSCCIFWGCRINAVFLSVLYLQRYF